MQLAFIAMNKRGRSGAAVYRKQKKVFRYALARGDEAPRAARGEPAAPGLIGRIGPTMLTRTRRLL